MFHQLINIIPGFDLTPENIPKSNFTPYFIYKNLTSRLQGSC